MSTHPQARSRKPADSPLSADLALVLADQLGQRLAGAILPGDDGFSPEELAAAARFMLGVAAQRAPGKPAIDIATVAGGAGERFMRIAAVNDDMPFLVDSIAATVAAAGLTISRLVHPLAAVRRDAAGVLEALPSGAAASGERRESFVYLETERADARARAALLRDLAAVLGDVRAAVGDWSAMQAVLADDADATLDSEGAALLRWLKDGMLTQLGHLRHYRDGREAEALGLCRRDPELLGAISYERAFAWFDAALDGSHAKTAAGIGRAPLVMKSNTLSTVHRRAPLDLFIVPVIENGKVAALSLHTGVWTSEALAAPPGQVPRIRAQLGALSQKFGFAADGHAAKTLVHALTALPHDLLISFTASDLERIATAAMSLIDRPRPKLMLVPAPLLRHAFAFVWLPRDVDSTATRLQIEAMLTEACGAPVLDWSLAVEGKLALLRFMLDLPVDAQLPEEAPLDAALRAMVRGWADAVEAEIAETEDSNRAAAIAARYAEAFPLAYRATYGPAEAATDIARLRKLAGEADLRAVRIHRLAEDLPGQLRLKLYQRSGTLALSDAVPALENFGFRVIENTPHSLDTRDGDGELGTIHDFLLAIPSPEDIGALLGHSPVIEAALGEVLNGHGENDEFNRLITSLRLPAREAGWLRAWYRYLRQAGLSYSITTAVDALESASAVTQGLLSLFHARHDPAYPEDRATGEAAAEAAIREGLAQVSAINDDRLLRRIHAVIAAILRTNAYLPSSADAFAFKLDSALVPGLPRPVPWREIFVYSARVEGIHLRAGPVARGGIRWSDRRDDFRTEILGLMKAQRVKNAVIVPTGAKGGFYPKFLPDPAKDREGWFAEGTASYRLFIRSLLALTDNLVDGQVVHPTGMVIHDGEDPYFVVAADKGTATFSDTANAIAAEFDFWLDDAFASGGSKGYDHKAMGITARGAWISVQRHFLELGTDVQTESVRAVGCGDMSGDVFGNGMLLSKALKLVAAFDHRHIFLDPDPDPAKSHAERARMFALPRSSWADYDTALISRGGGIFPRSLKEIPLSSEIQAVLGVAAETLDPDALISAILKAPVDLLWFGGIGTYVKATHEANGEVGDPANDTLRVNGRDIRAHVIGEGANLGCTQAGRIEYALSGHKGDGGRDDPDFIDNSAGVDCSDHEVNIKIALAAAKRSGQLTEDGRVAQLVEMTDEVAALVLEDNRLQALALSTAEAGGSAAIASQLRVIDALEAEGHLDRATEGLADSQTLARRAADGKGLTRPELAVVLSTTKLVLQAALEASTVPDDPAMTAELLEAFPAKMRGKFATEIETHRLRREIVATQLANRIVNRLGPVHPFELAEEAGVSLAQVTASFLAAEGLLGLPALWREIETAAMPEAARLALFTQAAIAVRVHMVALLGTWLAGETPSAVVAALAPGFAAIHQAGPTLLSAEAKAQSARVLAELTAAGAPEKLAADVVTLADISGAIGLSRLAGESGMAPEALARAYVALSERLGTDWAQATAARIRPTDPWERLLAADSARAFRQMRLDFLVSRQQEAGDDPLALVERWVAEQGEAITRLRGLIDRARAAPVPNAAMLAQIAEQARTVLGR